MRADKDFTKMAENNLIATANSGKSNKSLIFIRLLPFISILAIVGLSLFNDIDFIDMMKISVLAFLLTTAMVFFIRLQENIFIIRYSIAIIYISYLASILLILLPKNPEIYSFWMIGGLLVAMVVDSKIGLFVYFNLTLILSIAYSLRPETIIHFLIMGMLFIILSGSLKKKSTLVYGAIILLSSNITLLFIMNNFIFDRNINVNYVASLFSIMAVLLVAFLISNLYDKIINRDVINSEELVSQADDDINEDDKSENKVNSTFDRSIKTSYDLLLSDNNELLLKMKEHSMDLYNHSMLIGDLSERAANVIGANGDLARAGGYYHELGKIIGKNYINEGLILAEEYAFPEEIKKIIKEHNIKYEKPSFVESAIVMISDNVASTIEYIDKTEDKKFATDKIIDNIFRMRMDKGTFDDSGLSLRDFKMLKEFYQEEFKQKVIEEKTDDNSFGV